MLVLSRSGAKNAPLLTAVLGLKLGGITNHAIIFLSKFYTEATSSCHCTILKKINHSHARHFKAIAALYTHSHILNDKYV